MKSDLLDQSSEILILFFLVLITVGLRAS